jgi:peroxiredoxin
MIITKKIFFLFLLVMVFWIPILNADELERGKSIPAINLKDLLGKTINSRDFDNDGKPIVISFWATWCKPCIEELNTIAELYDAWNIETGVKVIAISIDDSRNSKRVAPFVKSRKWQFEVYLDENSDFKRAMGVSNPPHTFLLDYSKNVVFEHNGYAAGDELHLLEEIKKAIK